MQRFPRLIVFFAVTFSLTALGAPRDSREARRASWVTKIEGFIQDYTPYLTAELRSRQSDEDSIYVIHQDPLACRFCAFASHFLAEDLRKQFPQFTWEERVTLEEYQKFHHVYIYSPELDLMVDATYRQFLVSLQPREVTRLPKIFVGSSREFILRMKGYLPADVLSGYVFLTDEYKSRFTAPQRRTGPFVWREKPTKAASCLPHFQRQRHKS